ncbi:MAG: flagellar filament capping protein FliD [Azonexus sp.]|nr:flagellar filament capping protein FliD [Azonexus sp.]
MSINEIRGANSDFSLLKSTGKSASAPAEGADFLSTLKLLLADSKTQSIVTLASTASPFNADQSIASLTELLGASATPALSAIGRNTALFDPESAYRMMTSINAKEVTYKAELAEINDMKSSLATMQQEALKLGSIDSTTGKSDIQGRLQAFANAYNGWINRFNDELQAGGLLAGTQAATVSQWELEQSVENIFNGAKDGVRGMSALGLTIDPVTNLASLDTTRLNAIMASNPAGVTSSIQEFSANFAKSAELLNSPGNFIPNRMANLARAIDYIGDNKQSLQAEFGLGDVAQPTGQVARALAKYQASFGLT